MVWSKANWKWQNSNPQKWGPPRGKGVPVPLVPWKTNRHFPLFYKSKSWFSMFSVCLCFPVFFSVRLLFPCSPEINDLIPLFPKTPERASKVKWSCISLYKKPGSSWAKKYWKLCKPFSSDIADFSCVVFISGNYFIYNKGKVTSLVQGR